MNTPVSFLQTVRDAFAALRTDYQPLLKGLAVPVCAFLVVKFSWVPFSRELPLWAVFVFLFLGLVPLAWMGNVCMRVAMTGVAGARGWTRRETYASLFLILIVSLFIPSLAIATVILKMIRNDPQFHLSYASLIAGWFFSSSLLLYLMARLLPLFPYIAIGEKIHFRDIWSLSKGHAFSLMTILTCLVVTSYYIVAYVGFDVYPGANAHFFLGAVLLWCFNMMVLGKQRFVSHY